jgi:hypothetical protein
MSLLSDIVQEMDAAGAAAATTTSSVAATPGSLFAGGIVDPKNAKKKRGKLLRRAMNMKTEGAMSRLKESLGVDLGGADFDASDVISRIDAASKKEKQNDDTTAFGLEDEDGSMVKVYVRNDQAKEFETQLAALLAGTDEDNDEDNTSLEIAEVLYKLKDKFDIVDVEWPGIEGDEEEEQEVTGNEVAGAETGAAAGEVAGAEAGAGAGAEAGDLAGLEAGAEGEGTGEEGMVADEEGAESALKQVIDMMKADAEAKKAEADARAAEARAKEAEFASKAAGAKVRQDEQIYDMEAAQKEKSEQEKEAKQLADLARFQHQKAQDAEVKLSMEGKEEKEDEDEDENNRISLKDLSALIMRNLRHQH